MAIENIPVWPFEPNWKQSFTESLEWLTSVLSSKSGAEQRRALRMFPRKELEFTSTVEAAERSAVEQFVAAHGARTFYMPLWHESYRLKSAVAAGTTTLLCDEASNGGMKVGDVIFIGDLDSSLKFELAEIDAISGQTITLKDDLLAGWPAHAKVHPVRKVRLTDQPMFKLLTDNAANVTPTMRVMENNDDVEIENPRREAGPIIMDGLITNSYHEETGRGGYFHSNSGTSEGQFIFIYGALLAYEVLRTSSLVTELEAADYYLTLAQEMLDAMGDGSTTGPMLRQPVPADVNTITLMHWLFAARGDIPEQGIIYEYQTNASAGKLVIPYNASGAKVHMVWRIYPATSKLLYQSPFSPAFDVVAPAEDTSVVITEYERVGDTTVITIPPGAPGGVTAWKIVYGYYKPGMIARGDGFEAYPNWTRIAPGYSACAPDTFRWFEQAMERAIALDDRDGAATKWEQLRLAMRRTCVVGQAITDLREVFKQMPGFDVIPAFGSPDGMYCYSDHPSAVAPIGNGLDTGWVGYDFWSRGENGDIIGDIPTSPAVAQVQIGRGFSDTWRTATSYQDADAYLWVQVACSKKPVAANKEFFLVYLSSTMAYDPDARWYADIGSLAAFVATPIAGGNVIDFFIPRSAFKLRSWDEDGNTIWGSVLPAGTHIENFGISTEMAGSYKIRIRNIRLVAGNTAADEQGAEMPYFPGSLPFAINADTIKQAFVGWNGSPFHGYQLPDHWWWLGDDANYAHPTLTAAKLPLVNRTTGALVHPIASTTAGGAAKPKHALLMEQQLYFLLHAQDQWVVDGGDEGPFAHTFVLNTDARASLGSPTPHTWVYTNDDPNTRWVGYQVRIVESVAKIAVLAADAPGFATCVNMAVTMVAKWLARLNVDWPNLAGKMVDGKRIYGMPTDYDDPAKGPPETLYEEPHAAGIVMRTCLWMRMAGKGNAAINEAVMVRCWNYLEMVWRTEGEMKFTWSPDPEAKQWYGFWHGEIITTLALLLQNPAHVPAAINLVTVRQRLVETQTWLEKAGVAYNNSSMPVSFLDAYKGFNVITDEPERQQGLDLGSERLIDEFDPTTGLPLYGDTAGMGFQTRSYRWETGERADYEALRRLLYTLSGRFMAVWLPSFNEDFAVVSDTPPGAKYLTVKNIGFTDAGGPAEGRTYLCIFMNDGTRLYRKITKSLTNSSGNEVLYVDKAFYEGLGRSAVLRVSFMQLCRLNQDRIEISHTTDTRGTASCVATFRAAPNIRQMKSGF